MELTVPGEPRSKARPRFTGSGGVYSDKQQKAHEELLEFHLRLACKRPFEGGVGVGVTFFRSNKQRIDLDNLVKAVLDAANGIAFVDDVQVVELAARIDLDPENPRTVILVEPKVTSMPRGKEAEEQADCPTCGKTFSFRRYDCKPGGQVYCSRGCVGTADKGCEECGETFKPHGPRQRFCGKKCAAQSARTKRKIAGRRRRATLTL